MICDACNGKYGLCSLCSAVLEARAKISFTVVIPGSAHDWHRRVFASTPPHDLPFFRQKYPECTVTANNEESEKWLQQFNK